MLPQAPIQANAHCTVGCNGGRLCLQDKFFSSCEWHQYLLFSMYLGGEEEVELYTLSSTCFWRPRYGSKDQSKS